MLSIVLVIMAVAASTTAHAEALRARRDAGPTITPLFSQHEAASVYESAGVSSAGFIAAATWLNEPEVAEIFNLQGNKSIMSIGDTNPLDESMFHIDIATASTEAIVSKTAPNEFFSTIFLFDTSSGNAGPEWNTTLENSEVLDIAISADGSTAAVAAFGLGPTIRVIVIDTATGQERPEYRWELPMATREVLVSLSASGDYVGILAGSAAGVRVDVVHSQGRHSANLTNVTIDSTVGQAFGISADGMYVAAGQAYDLFVWQRNDSSPLSYSVLTHVHMPDNFVSAGTIAFSPDSAHMSVAWQGLNNTISQNIVQLYPLPATTPSLDVTLAPQTGNLPNWPVQTAVSPGGKHVAYCCWGAEGKQPGAAQLQVFLGDGSSSSSAAVYTPGSMFACGIGQMKDGTIVAAAAGKHVHATIMGNGGDMYAVKVE